MALHHRGHHPPLPGCQSSAIRPRAPPVHARHPSDHCVSSVPGAELRRGVHYGQPEKHPGSLGRVRGRAAGRGPPHPGGCRSGRSGPAVDAATTTATVGRAGACPTAGIPSCGPPAVSGAGAPPAPAVFRRLFRHRRRQPRSLRTRCPSRNRMPCGRPSSCPRRQCSLGWTGCNCRRPAWTSGKAVGSLPI